MSGEYDELIDDAIQRGRAERDAEIRQHLEQMIRDDEAAAGCSDIDDEHFYSAELLLDWLIGGTTGG